MKRADKRYVRFDMGTNRLLKIFLLLNLIWLITQFFSCQRKSDTFSKLLDAENVIYEYPDSALTILKSLNIDDLNGEKEKSLYGLLYTMALDKNHLDPLDITLISDATDYYREKNDIPHLIQSEYYQGRVHFLNKDYPKALVNFFKAKDLAEKFDNMIFWAGMSCRGISDIYAENFNSADELYYAEKEYDYIQRSGQQPYINYSILDLCGALNNNNQSEKALEKLDGLLDSALKYEDVNLYIETLRKKALDSGWSQNQKEAIEIFKELCRTPYATAEDSLNLCINLIETEEFAEAEKLVEIISDTDRPFKEYIRYRIFQNKGDYKRALQELENLYETSTSTIRESMSNNLSSSMAEYFELNQKYEETVVENERFRFLILVFASLVIIMTLGGIIYFIRQKYILEIEEKVKLAVELEESLDDSKKHNQKSRTIIKNLLGSRYSLLEELGDILRINSDSKSARKQIADKVVSLINDYSESPSQIRELEEELDASLDNLYSDFSNDVPGLKDSDKRLFLYSVLGFSMPVIALFLKEKKIESVYNRKRRLKEKIRQLETPKNERYLSFLG